MIRYMDYYYFKLIKNRGVKYWIRNCCGYLLKEANADLKLLYNFVSDRMLCYNL